MYQTGKSLKQANRLSSDFLLSFFLLSVTVSQASTITAVAITTIQTRKNILNHWVLHSPPIDVKELGLVGDFQNSMCLYACLYTPFFRIRQLRHQPEATKHV